VTFHLLNKSAESSALHKPLSTAYTQAMTTIHIFTASLLTVACISCAPQKSDAYDTATAPLNPPAAASEPVNPVYDTPAAYEAAGSSATPPPAVAKSPSAIARSPKAPSNGAATIHTVVAGDTLSGISAKYKVPAASIKQANSMTKDTVVLGKKMVIPTSN
jgi:hypothetical protein